MPRAALLITKTLPPLDEKTEKKKKKHQTRANKQTDHIT